MKETYTQQDIVTKLGFINFQIEFIISQDDDYFTTEVETQLGSLLVERTNYRRILYKLATQK